MLVEGFPDREVIIKGEKYLYFGGTSYLGMATHKSFLKQLSKNIQRWGSFYGSSRNANIKLAIYEQFETFFSTYVGAEASLAISSGTLAGKLVIDHLEKENRYFFHYPRTHPAILAKNSLPLFTEKGLHPQLLKSQKDQIVITLDAILSEEVKPTSLDFLNNISKDNRVTLVIDESHSLGVVGRKGQGVFSATEHPLIERKIMIASLGKSLGLSGGIIASDKEFIKKVKNSSIFASASGANPAYLQTFLDTQSIYLDQQKKLTEHLNYVNSLLKPRLNCKFEVNYPVLYLSDASIYDTLLKERVIITRFKYPTYTQPMNRVVFTSNHTKNDLKKVITLLNVNL